MEQQVSSALPRAFSAHPQAVKEWIAQNGPCVECGSADRLEVDHRNPEDKELNPRSLWSMSPQNPRRIAELAKCQVLCRSCHKAKTRPQLVETGIRKAAIRPRDESGRWCAAGATNV